MKYKKALWAYIACVSVVASVNVMINNVTGTIFCCTVMLMLWQEVRHD